MGNGIGEYLREFLAEFGAGGGIDLPDCAVGALCAQTDLEAARFIENIKKKYPEKLKDINAKLQIVQENTNKSYGWKIGVDADGVVHTYKGQPIEKILNIWNYGTGDGKVPRTRFWSAAIRKLKGTYDRAGERFFDLLDKRFSGKSSNAPNSGTDVSSKIVSYMNNKSAYLDAAEVVEVSVLKKSQVDL